MAINTNLLIITSNINGLNAPVKRYRVAEWIRKQDPYICCLQETYLESKDTHRLKVKGWKKTFHANEKGKEAGVTIFISNKIDFRTKVVVGDKGWHYIMIKGTIQQEVTTLVNFYASNIGAPKYVKQILMDIKGETDSYIVIVEDFNTLLTSMDKSVR